MEYIRLVFVPGFILARPPARPLPALRRWRCALPFGYQRAGPAFWSAGQDSHPDPGRSCLGASLIPTYFIFTRKPNETKQATRCLPNSTGSHQQLKKNRIGYAGLFWSQESNPHIRCHHPTRVAGFRDPFTFKCGWLPTRCGYVVYRSKSCIAQLKSNTKITTPNDQYPH